MGLLSSEAATCYVANSAGARELRARGDQGSIDPVPSPGPHCGASPQAGEIGAGIEHQPRRRDHPPSASATNTTISYGAACTMDWRSCVTQLKSSSQTSDFIAAMRAKSLDS